MEAHVAGVVVYRRKYAAHRPVDAVVQERFELPRVVLTPVAKGEFAGGHVVVFPHRVLHAKRLEDLARNVTLIRLARDAPDDLTEHGEGEVAVFKSDARG